VKTESIAFLVSGVFFGLLVGWMLGSQQAAPAPPVAAAPAQAASSAPASAPALDTGRAAELEQNAKASPNDAAVRVELANLYFNAERFDLAVPWYEAALKLNPKDINATTDLGVCYYYTNQVDRALAQFDASLAMDPRHVKTLFNQGVVLAFGKQDLKGAQQAWERVVALSPDSEEGKRARQGLDGLKAAHSNSGGGASEPPPAGRQPNQE
jgi:tetratricopeptide (TPR) repeat protein